MWEVQDLENDRGLPILPKAYRLYNKYSPRLISYFRYICRLVYDSNIAQIFSKLFERWSDQSANMMKEVSELPILPSNGCGSEKTDRPQFDIPMLNMLKMILNVQFVHHPMFDL